jgi:RNA recognition motif-containing protein
MEQTMKIFVGNLALDVSEEELNSLFAEHGNVSGVKIIRDNSNHISRGFGFVEMVRKVEAKKALKKLNEFEFKGKNLIVKEAKPGRDRKSAGGKNKYHNKRR